MAQAVDVVVAQMQADLEPGGFSIGQGKGIDAIQEDVDALAVFLLENETGDCAAHGVGQKGQKTKRRYNLAS